MPSAYCLVVPVAETAPQKTPPTVHARYDPIALDRSPEVGILLDSLGFGQLLPEETTAYVGRNDNWAGRTTNGVEIFVKKITGPSPSDARNRFNRILAFDRLMKLRPVGLELGPKILGTDPDALLVAFELLSDGRSGRELAAENTFDTGLCRQAGEIIADLHASEIEDASLDESPHPLPPVRGFEHVSLAAYLNATAGELEMWRLLQSDAGLADAIRRLRGLEVTGPDQRPIHGDIRLDQFLETGGRLCLLDWEEFRWGDPARDVGAFIGEWLYLAVHAVPRSLNAEPGRGFGLDATHEEVLAGGVTEITKRRPAMVEFWTAYCERHGSDRGLAVRAAGFAGWHMFDRMFASASSGAMRLPAADRAAAGIGRKILISPDTYLAALGLELPA